MAYKIQELTQIANMMASQLREQQDPQSSSQDEFFRETDTFWDSQ